MAGSPSKSAGETSDGPVASSVIPRRMRWMMSSMRTATATDSHRDLEAQRLRAALAEPANAFVPQIDIDAIAPGARQLELVFHADTLLRMDVARDQRAQRLVEEALPRVQPPTDHHRSAPRRRQRTPHGIAYVLDLEQHPYHVMVALGRARRRFEDPNHGGQLARPQTVAQRRRALRLRRLGSRRRVIEARHLGRIAARGHGSLIEPYRLVTPALDRLQSMRDHDQSLAGSL